jgi:nucleoside-diphosphate-sugar epimerase
MALRIVLTGSSGRLGRHLGAALRADGHRVTGVDAVAGPETQVLGSIASRAVVNRAFAFGADAVVHTAALHQPDLPRAPMHAFIDVNVTGTLHVLQAARAAGCAQIVLASSTSLMIDGALSAGHRETAVFLDEASGPLAPRNIYGATKQAAENLARLFADTATTVTALRLSRFFAGHDADGPISGDNLKAVELLHRRLTIADAVGACQAALGRSEGGFATYVVSAPTPFARHEAADLARDAAGVIARHFPEAPALFAARGWLLPQWIDRVYDAGLITRDLGFRCRTDFAALLDGLRLGQVPQF